MTDLEILMREWLESGSPIQKQHATTRIAMGFEGIINAPPIPPPPSPPRPFEPLSKSWVDRINTCPYRECRTGCQRSKCWAGRGDEVGDVSILECRDCLRGLFAALPISGPGYDPSKLTMTGQ